MASPDAARFPKEINVRGSPSPGDNASGRGGVAALGLRTPGGMVGDGSMMMDPELETPRRVMFGAPMAAEFNHLSPSNRLTPMPSRDAKVS